MNKNYNGEGQIEEQVGMKEKEKGRKGKGGNIIKKKKNERKGKQRKKNYIHLVWLKKEGNERKHPVCCLDYRRRKIKKNIMC